MPTAARTVDAMSLPGLHRHAVADLDARVQATNGSGLVVAPTARISPRIPGASESVGCAEGRDDATVQHAMKPAKKTGIHAVCWWTSPACARILEWLECKGPARPDELAAHLHITHKYAENLTRMMRSYGVIYVKRWRRNINGSPTPVYALGNHKSKAMPKQESNADRCRRRREYLSEKYGSSVASKVLNPKPYGYPMIVIDGERVTSASARSYVGGGR